MSDTKHIDNGGPAFPLQSIGPEFQPGHCGMTLRDWFAGQALAGDMAAQNDAAGIFGNDISDKAIRERAAIYFRFADAMLAARKEKV